MKNYFYIFILSILLFSTTFPQNIWINEFSYDCADNVNGAPDGDEFVEIVAPVGTDMSNYGLVFYFYSEQDEVYFANYYSQLSGTISSTNSDEGKGFFIVKTAYSERLESYSPIPFGISTQTLENAEIFNDKGGIAIVESGTGNVLHSVLYELQVSERSPETILTEKYVETPTDWQISEISLVDKNVNAVRLPLLDSETSSCGGSISMIGSGYSGIWTVTNEDAPNFSTPGNLNYSQNSLPVELTSFSANVADNFVKLNWRTETEVNNYGFDVERKSENSNWEKINFVNGNGNSNSPKDYIFIDKAVKSGKFSYRLKQIDNDGQYSYSKIVEITFNKIIEYYLTQNYPNPFNPTTKINFNLPVAENVKLTVYNLLGQEIKTLVNGYKESGVYNYTFDAKELNSGIYIYKLESGNYSQTRKMTLVK